MFFLVLLFGFVSAATIVDMNKECKKPSMTVLDCTHVDFDEAIYIFPRKENGITKIEILRLNRILSLKNLAMVTRINVRLGEVGCSQIQSHNAEVTIQLSNKILICGVSIQLKSH